MKQRARTRGRGNSIYQQFVRGSRREASRSTGRLGSPADIQKGMATLTAIAGNLVPLTQKQVQEAMNLMAENGRASAELVRKAMDAAQTPSFTESQTKWLDFWLSSLKAAQTSAAAATRLGTRALTSWIDFARDNTELARSYTPEPA